MSYVSPFLTHFVGRSEPDDEARMKLLLKIIGEGRLGIPEIRGNLVIDNSSMLIPGDGSLCEDEFIKFRPVCFCDIPKKGLERHTRFYGRFGLAFRKEFLSRLGANPVFYVAKGSFVKLRQPQMSTEAIHESMGSVEPPPGAYFGDWSAEPEVLQRCKFFDELSKEVLQVLPAPWPEGTPADAVDPWRELQSQLKFEIIGEVFAFMKFFDESLRQDDEENFYMEREWRVVGSVRFQLSDIKRVYVAPGFLARARNALPKLRIEELHFKSDLA